MKNRSNLQGDEFLVTGFFVALTALFCAMWPENVPIASISQLPHPPAPVRIEYAIRVAIMWSGQNASVPESWFDADRFEAIYLAATAAIAGGARSQWDALVAFLRSDAGKEYDRQLSEQFELVRKASEEAVQSDMSRSSAFAQT